MYHFEKLNHDIKQFPQVFPIDESMTTTFSGVSRTVMLDRYAFKDTERKTLGEGDFVILTVKEDPKWPVRGTGIIQSIDRKNQKAVIAVEEEFTASLKPEEAETGLAVRSIDTIEKPLELYYEQIAKRNAAGLASVEATDAKRSEWFEAFYQELVSLNFIPAGRVLYGAGSKTETTFFNCYVMPYPPDSRGGISEHRKEVMEIMSRGGGVGTNGSTLRPRHTLARGVNGRSSGAVSWLDDIAKLTHLVEQGGSRRGAQMIMLADWHPDIIEFIISKMQNPRILRYLIENTTDTEIREQAERKLKFTPFTPLEIDLLKTALSAPSATHEMRKEAEAKLRDGGTYDVHNPEFLSGANISVNFTNEFMEAVEQDADYPLRFPDIEQYSKDEMAAYNEKWQEVGDIREWEALGYGIRTYRTIKARELWNLVNICATYAAEPGIFFIDNANEMTNAVAYGQKVVATNPCGEQPLAPYSVCNLAAVNLAQMADKTNKTVDYDKLRRTVETGVRMQDNVIDATPYFLEKNKHQALGERRVGLGVMGLADLLIYCEKEYGSPEGNELVDSIFEVIATTAYRTSIKLAKEKGSFPFLNDRHHFTSSGYMKKMPEDIREGVIKYGIRNSHLLTVAPTGSTGTMAGVGTGLEPYFSFSYFRSGRLGKFIEVKADIVNEYLEEHPEADPHNLPKWFATAMGMTPEAHVDTQCIIQRWVDSSISKTVNAPKGYTVEQVQKVYERLYKGGAKGGTVYVDGSRSEQVLTLKAEENTMADITSEGEPWSYGNEIGDRCPICREGEVKEIGGCNTCDQCGMQLKCGL